MKKIYIALVGFLFTNIASAQITISTSDMPSVGDTFRVSNGLIDPTIDPVPTGTSFTWDFSNLQMVTQDVDSFISVSSTGAIYSLVFSNIPFNPYRANLAAKGPTLPAVPQVTISDVNYFYYNTSASYVVSGYGATINGVQAPIPFNNKDYIYNFPVNFGDTDSSDSDFQLALPGFGFYSHAQHRVNSVDGWGTLITPFGTFNTVRVKSMITSNDSIYLDSLGTGFAFSLPPTTEYKWLGTQAGIPLLQITTTNTLGADVVSAIVYQDSVRTLTGIHELSDNQTVPFELYPNPTTGDFTLDLATSDDHPVKVSLLTSEGKMVAQLWEGVVLKGENALSIETAKLKISNGMYLVQVETGQRKSFRPLVINR